LKLTTQVPTSSQEALNLMKYTQIYKGVGGRCQRCDLKIS